VLEDSYDTLLPVLQREEFDQMTDVDHEISAMAAVSKALDGLGDDAQARVLDWAVKRFHGASPTLAQRTTHSGRERDMTSDVADTSEFGSFVDLFDTASPSGDNDKALVGGYWFQVVEGRADFGSQEVNNALKNLGYGISNITRSLDRLQERRPALVRQVSKSGRTKQARKRYKLTEAGLSAVKELVTTGDEG
jgi:hypothetical protein